MPTSRRRWRASVWSKRRLRRPWERGRFHRITGDYYRTFVRTERLRALAGPLTETLATVGTVVILWYGARLVVVQGELSGAQFVGFLALSLKLYAPVKYVAKFPALVQPGLAGAERVFEFLDAPVEIRDRAGARPMVCPETGIAFEDVDFEYEAGELGAPRSLLRRAEGKCRRAGGTEWRWQDDNRGSAGALLRRDVRPRRDRRRRRQGPHSLQLEGCHGHRLTGDGALPR